MLSKKDKAALAHRQAAANLNVARALNGFESSAIALEDAAAERLSIADVLAQEANDLYAASLSRQQESTAIGVEAEKNAAAAKRIRELFL